MNIKITQIDHNSKYLKDVIALGDANKNTLGLFPKDAYKESASKKQIIIAVDAISGNLVGYLLFNLSRRKMLVSIVHLCVATTWRGKKISQQLFDELKRITQDGYLSVRVRCRVDYPANQLWPKLGFVAMGEMKGRGKKETRLNIWKYEFPHQSLFSYTALQNENIKTKVVIDANVYYQLQFPELPENEESLPLFEPWLDIDLFITPELLNEINRNPDFIKKEAARKFAGSFEMVDSKTSHKNYQKIQSDLRYFFPKKLKQSDESDLRQLAYAIADDIPFFVTRDGPMLGRAEAIFEKFGIQILRPSDLILLQDELLRGDDYAPSRLAGSQIRLEKVHTQQSQKIVERFLSDQIETKSAFNKKLQILLSNAATTETYLVKDASGEELGLVSYSKQTSGEVLVHLLRVGKSQICQYIAKYLVNYLVLGVNSFDKGRILVDDEYLPDKVVYALQEMGFLKTSVGWEKISLRQVLSVKEIENRLPGLSSSEYLETIVSTLQSNPSASVLLEVERYLWPLKLRDIDISVFIVPIRPEWAMHLFDVDIARQDLFGSEPTLILNSENVYYRSSTPKVLTAPGRILWYVSAGNKRYQGAMQIKACSYLDDVEIGKPKQLFSKYRKLGIYKWNDVFKDVAKGDLNKDIMAFKFSKTEVFSSPISLVELQVMWKNNGKNFNNAVSPLAVDQERFFEIYNLGMKGRKDEK